MVVNPLHPTPHHNNQKRAYHHQVDYSGPRSSSYWAVHKKHYRIVSFCHIGSLSIVLELLGILLLPSGGRFDVKGYCRKEEHPFICCGFFSFLTIYKIESQMAMSFHTTGKMFREWAWVWWFGEAVYYLEVISLTFSMAHFFNFSHALFFVRSGWKTQVCEQQW